MSCPRLLRGCFVPDQSGSRRIDLVRRSALTMLTGFDVVKVFMLMPNQFGIADHLPMIRAAQARTLSFRITDGLFDGTARRGRSDFPRHHHPDDSAAECGGLEDLPLLRRIGSASHPAPVPYGRARDKARAQASGVVAWVESPLRGYPNVREKLLSLQHRKAQ